MKAVAATQGTSTRRRRWRDPFKGLMKVRVSVELSLAELWYLGEIVAQSDLTDTPDKLNLRERVASLFLNVASAAQSAVIEEKKGVVVRGKL